MKDNRSLLGLRDPKEPLTSFMHNVLAWRLGEACRAADPGGDLIDLGLSLLRELNEQGFDVIVRLPEKDVECDHQWIGRGTKSAFVTCAHAHCSAARMTKHHPESEKDTTLLAAQQAACDHEPQPFGGCGKCGAPLPEKDTK